MSVLKKQPILNPQGLLEAILADCSADPSNFQPLKNSFKKLLQIQRSFKVHKNANLPGRRPTELFVPAPQNEEDALVQFWKPFASRCGQAVLRRAKTDSEQAAKTARRQSHVLQLSCGCFADEIHSNILRPSLAVGVNLFSGIGVSRGGVAGRARGRNLRTIYAALRSNKQPAYEQVLPPTDTNRPAAAQAVTFAARVARCSGRRPAR